jgi:hypothetical protein
MKSASGRLSSNLEQQYRALVLDNPADDQLLDAFSSGEPGKARERFVWQHASHPSKSR